MKRSIAAVLLVLSVCHAQPWTQQAASSQSVADSGDGCECGDVDNCIYCTTTNSNNPCYDKCQWCIPQLSCQKVDKPGESKCPPPPPPVKKMDTTIGAHQQYKCQDFSGNGPIVNQVLFTTTGGDSVPLWNGTDSTMAPDSFAGVPTNPVKGEHTITARGLNWGEQNKTYGPNKTSMLGINQAIQICPFANMDVSGKTPPNSNPVGPSLDTCFNCTEYGDADELDLIHCDGGVPPGYQPTDKYWPVSNKNAVCSRLTCTGIPPGIGGNYAVFVSIHGEPPSVVVGEVPPLDRPQATAFTTQYARLNYALPVITNLSSSNSVLICDDKACEAAPGDLITVTADNLPNNELVVETYRRGLSPEKRADDIVYIQLGGIKCPLVANANSTSTTEAVCTVPVSSGRGLNLTLVVARQSNIIPSTFNYPIPNVSGVSPSKVPSYGGTITIAGLYFADKGTVDIGDTTDPAKTHACEVVQWSEKQIICNTASSGGAAQIAATVTVTVASGSSDASLIYEPCSFASRGESCLSDGKYTCSNNSVCPDNNCNVAGATCSCPSDGDHTFCGNGGTLNSDCGCNCMNGWGNSGNLIIEGAVPTAYTNGTCSSCPVSCSGLDKKVSTSSKCGCEFNMLHLIWIIFLGLLVLGAIGFGIWKWQSMQPKKVALSTKPLLNTLATDEEQGDRRDQENSVTEM